MSTATFIGYDLITGPDWQATPTRRGSAGYSLADSVATPVESLPSYITSVDWSALTYNAGGNSATWLTRPGGGAALGGRYYTGGANDALVNATDGASHYLSIYCADDTDGSGGRTQAITIRDASDADLASHSITYDFTPGVWITFLVSGYVKVHLAVTGSTTTAVISGVAWDETEPPTAEAGASVPGTGTLALDAITVAGSGTTSGGAIVATGSLTVGSVTASSSAGTTIPTTGSLTLGAVVITGDDLSPGTATFIGYDLITGPDWQATPTRRGSAGYWLSDSDASTVVQSLPSYVSSVDHSDPFLLWNGSGYAPTRLTRPGGGSALAGRYYDTGSATILINATDGASHYLSIYCADDPGTDRTQAINILDGSGSQLVSHNINYNFDSGVWLCFLVSGYIKVQIQTVGGTGTAVISGLTWDETEPPTAEAGSSIPGSGSLAVTSLNLTGSNESSVAATGSLAVGSAVFAASAGLVVNATGSLAVASVGVAGSSLSVIAASGSLSVASLTESGSGVVSIPGSGSLAITSIGMVGSSTSSVTATGSLAVGSVAFASSAGATVHGSGSMTVGSIAIAGSGSSIVPASGSLTIGPITDHASVGLIVGATGSLAVDSMILYSSAFVYGSGSASIDDVTISGSAQVVTYIISDPFAAYTTTCVATASGKCNCTTGS